MTLDRFAEFFEFQLITRCKRERREIYVPRFVREDALRAIPASGAREQLRNVSGVGRRKKYAAPTYRGRDRRNERVVTSSYLIHEYCGPDLNFANYAARCSCQLADISRSRGFFSFIDLVFKK